MVVEEEVVVLTAEGEEVLHTEVMVVAEVGADLKEKGNIATFIEVKLKSLSHFSHLRVNTLHLLYDFSKKLLFAALNIPGVN